MLKENTSERLISLYRKPATYLIFAVYYIVIIKRAIGDLTVCFDIAFIDPSKILKSFSTFSIKKKRQRRL